MSIYYIVYADTADARAQISDLVYLTARASTVASSTTLDPAFCQNSFSLPNYSCGQYFGVYDTSAVPAGAGSGSFFFRVASFLGNADSDTIRVREVSTVANKIAGASLSGLTPVHSDPGTFPTTGGYFEAPVSDVSAIPRNSSFKVVLHTVKEETGTTPLGVTGFQVTTADNAGTTFDPYIFLALGTAWDFVGVSNVVEVTTTAHALVTTGISGLAAGDLLVACISSRIASTTAITLPSGGEWTLVSEQKNNNTATNTSATPSGMMAYCVRGGSDPNLTFTHPTAPSVALGRIVAYRNVDTGSPKDTQTSFTTATNVTAVSGTGLTTGQDDDLIVAMACGGQEATWSAFAAATDPTTSSGTGSSITSDPAPNAWLERADSNTVTGADTSLAIFDAVKTAAGATGNLTATASLAAAQVVVAGAFKLVPTAAADTLFAQACM